MSRLGLSDLDRRLYDKRVCGFVSETVIVSIAVRRLIDWDVNC
jgi:hypothetical protein